ncbi:MAG: tetratricopeptide repeat protein [Sedimentisphaerales bacterium]|nr:tetratricopeptide repeat protein [Sedimentisphaerales bacterium]
MRGSLISVLGRGIDIHPVDLLAHWLERHMPQAEQARRILAQIRSGALLTGPDMTWLQGQVQQGTWYLVAQAAAELLEDLLSRAIIHLEQVRQTQPNNTTALYVLGICRERLGHEAQAIACYQDCLKVSPNLELPLQRLAAIAFKDLQLEQAIAYYQQLKQAQPESMQIGLLLGQMEIAAGLYTPAAKTLEHAILMNPGAFAWHDPDIELLIEDGQYRDALARLDLQLAATQPSPELLAKKAQLLRLMDELPEAEWALRSAVQVCPTYLEAFVHLAGLHLQQGRPDQAATAYLQALEANETYLEAYLWLAKSYNLAGRNQAAIETIESALELVPNSIYLMGQAIRSMAADRLGGWLDPGQLKAVVNRLMATGEKIDPWTSAYVQALTEHKATAAYELAGDLAVPSPGETLDALHRIASGDINPLVRLAELPSENDLKVCYQAALLSGSRFKFAGSILNLASDIGRWPTSQVMTGLAGLGVIARADLYGHWLEMAFDLGSNET